MVFASKWECTFKSTEVQIPLNCNWVNVLSYTSVVVEAVEHLGMSQHIWFDTPTPVGRSASCTYKIVYFMVIYCVIFYSKFSFVSSLWIFFSAVMR